MDNKSSVEEKILFYEYAVVFAHIVSFFVLAELKLVSELSMIFLCITFLVLSYHGYSTLRSSLQKQALQEQNPSIHQSTTQTDTLKGTQ